MLQVSLSMYEFLLLPRTKGLKYYQKQPLTAVQKNGVLKTILGKNFEKYL